MTFVLLLAAAVTSSSPFEHEALGHCFDRADEFVLVTMGKEALSDPNINMTEKGRWTWIIDQTATTNYTWFLLETSGGKKCLRAYVPAASQVEFKCQESPSRIDAFIAPNADYPAKLVEFFRAPGSVSFRASRCFVLMGGGTHRATRKPASCEHLLD
ncbi:MAG: hypothetical protein KDA57_20525 [Planctomycetales bacterium]|nr:hypothetical protein [Planctomycetales bacterium]